MTTYIANLWNNFILGVFAPFNKMSERKIKLQATIQMDKAEAEQRHVEELLRIQERLAEHNTRIVQEATSVVKEWLSGLTKLSGVSIVAPPVNDDERQWKLEQEKYGPEIPDDLEHFIRQELSNL
jgi:hypothetical protein